MYSPGINCSPFKYFIFKPPSIPKYEYNLSKKSVITSICVNKCLKALSLIALENYPP